MNFPTADPIPGGDGRSNWVATAEARQALRLQDRYRRASLGLVSGMRRPMLRAGEGMFPFRLYLAQLALGQAAMLAAFPDKTTWWRTFLVRCGEINYVALSGDGCDGYDSNPDSDFFPDAVTPFQAPDATELFYVYISMVGAVPTLGMGTAAPGDWSGFPVSDGSHWLIGVINTLITPQQALVRQLLRADNPDQGGGGSDIMLTVVSESANTLACTDAGSAAYTVAKPPELRGFTASGVDGQGNNYEILRPYVGGTSIIFATQPTGGTGVAGVTWQDLNVSARAIATELPTCESISGTPTPKHRYFVCSQYL